MPRSNKSGRGSIRVAVRNLRRCTIAQSDLIDKFEKYQRGILVSRKDIQGPGLCGANAYKVELNNLRLRKLAVEDLIASAERYRDTLRLEKLPFPHPPNSLFQTCKAR